MKRGLITWDKTEVRPEVFEGRVSQVRRVLAERSLPALIVYSELWRSNQARFLSNYMPYFNRALLIVPSDLPLTLLCGLSPRVYGWIRSVTTIEDIRPAGNFAKPLFQLAAERNWTSIGALELDQFPYDIYKSLRSGPLDVANIESAAVFAPDHSELAIRRKALSIASQILTDEIQDGVGSIDHHFVGRLERRFRRAGAEDLITLVTNGRTVPSPPAGETLEKHYSVSVAMEYRGHWVRLTRPQAPAQLLADCRRLWESGREGETVRVIEEALDGSYPYESGHGKITAFHIELNIEGKRLFYGDTIL